MELVLLVDQETAQVMESSGPEYLSADIRYHTVGIDVDQDHGPLIDPLLEESHPCQNMLHTLRGGKTQKEIIDVRDEVHGLVVHYLGEQAWLPIALRPSAVT